MTKRFWGFKRLRKHRETTFGMPVGDQQLVAEATWRFTWPSPFVSLQTSDPADLASAVYGFLRYEQLISSGVQFKSCKNPRATEASSVGSLV